MPRRFRPADWPHGLRCIDCGREFTVGQPLSERLYAMDTYAFEPMACVEIVCAGCAVVWRAETR